MLKYKLVFAAGLLLSLGFAPGLNAQAGKWVVPPNVIDFSSPPKISSLPGSPSTAPYRVANGAFDSTGNLLFYVSQGQRSSRLEVFDSKGNKIDELASAVDSLQVAVIPMPLSCDLKYYIAYFSRSGFGPKAPLFLVYSVFDAKLGIISKDVVVPPGRLGVTPGIISGTSAVTPLRSGTTRFLYGVNHGSVDKFLIGPSSISFDKTLVESVSRFPPSQTILSSDGSKLALGTDRGILVVTLDSMGDFSDSEVLEVTSPSGLAFSRDGNMLFFGDGGDLDYVRLTDPTRSVITLPGSERYGNSQLQLAVNDKIYAAGLNDDFDFVLGAIDLSGSTPSFTRTAVPGIVADYFPEAFTLPVQIAGEPLCGNPALVQSTFGVKGNFEVVVPHSCGGLAHYQRDNDNGSRWYGPFLFGTDVGAVDAVSMIQSDYGNLEVIARIGDRLAHFWRGGQLWHGPTFFASGVSGTPSFIQGNLGEFAPPGDFELVTPLAAGGLAHYSRKNSQGGLWIGPTLFASDLGSVTDVSLIQSTLGASGNNLEVVARIGDRLAHFWRGGRLWHGPGFFASGISGTPSLIQGNYANPGGHGNFELVAPLATGGMAHYWRNDRGEWRGPIPFSDGSVRSVSLIQSNYGQNFEVVARRDCSLVHYWRTDPSAPSPWTWYRGTTLIP